MKHKSIKKLIHSPEVIPGIYNYCDSWCERCAFTRRCVNFSMRQSVEDGTFEKEMDDLMESFEDPFEKFDIELPDIEDIPYDPEEQEEEKQIEQKVEENECAILSMAYADMVTDWLKANEEMVKKLEVEEDTNLPEKTLKLKDDIEVVSWYLYQIHVKLMRALHGLVDDILDEQDGYPKDSDGSAKVALIGIDNSTAAWKDLAVHLPDQEIIPDILLMLEQLTKMVEKNFPDARAFIRPGFDETQN